MLLQHITSRIPFRILDNMTTIASPHTHNHTHTHQHTHDKMSLTLNLDMEHTTSPSTHKRKRESSIVHISHITSPTHTTILISPRHLQSPSASCRIASPSHTEEKERHLKIARTEPSPSPSPSRSPCYEFAIPSIPSLSPSSRPSPSPSPPHHPVASPKPSRLSTFTSSVSSPISIHCPPPPSSSRAGQRNTFSFALPAAATSSSSTSSSSSTIPRRRPSQPMTTSTSTSTTSSPSQDPSPSMTSFSFFQRSSATPTSSSISAPTTTRSSSFSLPRLPNTTCVSPRTVQLSPLILSPRQPAQSPPFHALSSPASSPSLSALTSPSASSSTAPSLSPVSTPVHQTTSSSQSFSSPAIPPSSSPSQSYSPAPGSPSTSRPAHMLHSNLYVLPSTSPSLTATASIPTLSPLTWKPANVQALRVRIPEAVGKITLLAPTPPDTKACLIRERERQREAEMNDVTCHVGRYHAVSTRKGIRRHMEDTYICRPAYTCSSDAFFGVYDGHGRDGKQASEIAARMFPEQLKLCDEFQKGDIMNAFRTCYAQVDAHTVSRVSNGGTTATCIYLRGRTLHIANVGDSRAMLCRNGLPHVLTSDHKPHDDAEKLRIEAAGGHVIYCATSWRVEGILNISRSIGDAKLKSYVTSTPDVTSIELTDTDDLLVIGTDGMWSVLSSQRVLEIATACKTPAEATEALARETTQQHSKDNICIMVISLKDILAQETPKWE